MNRIVVATGGAGLSRLVRASQAKKLAREPRLFTLFVPSGGRTFVSGEPREATYFGFSFEGAVTTEAPQLPFRRWNVV